MATAKKQLAAVNAAAAKKPVPVKVSPVPRRPGMTGGPVNTSGPRRPIDPFTLDPFRPGMTGHGFAGYFPVGPVNTPGPRRPIQEPVPEGPFTLDPFRPGMTGDGFAGYFPVGPGAPMPRGPSAQERYDADQAFKKNVLPRSVFKNRPSAQERYDATMNANPAYQQMQQLRQQEEAAMQPYQQRMEASLNANPAYQQIQQLSQQFGPNVSPQQLQQLQQLQAQLDNDSAINGARQQAQQASLQFQQQYGQPIQQQYGQQLAQLQQYDQQQNMPPFPGTGGGMPPQGGFPGYNPYAASSPYPVNNPGTGNGPYSPYVGGPSQQVDTVRRARQRPAPKNYGGFNPIQGMGANQYGGFNSPPPNMGQMGTGQMAQQQQPQTQSNMFGSFGGQMGTGQMAPQQQPQTQSNMFGSFGGQLQGPNQQAQQEDQYNNFDNSGNTGGGTGGTGGTGGLF